MDPRQLSIEVAEAYAGRRLDRRKKYALLEDMGICVSAEWTESCTGCFEGGENMGLAHHYLYDIKARCYIGAGCEECGYTGKRRVKMWVPLEAETVDPKKP